MRGTEHSAKSLLIARAAAEFEVAYAIVRSFKLHAGRLYVWSPAWHTLMNPAWAALGSKVSRPSEQTSVSSGRLPACLYMTRLEGWLGEPPYYSQADLE